MKFLLASLLQVYKFEHLERLVQLNEIDNSMTDSKPITMVSNIEHIMKTVLQFFKLETNSYG